MLSRVVSATVGIGLALLAIYLGGWWFVAALAILILIGQREFFALVRAKGYHPSESLCLGFSAALLVVQQAQPEWTLPLLIVGGTFLCMALLFRSEPGTIGDMGANVLGLFYAAFLPSFLIRLRGLDQGMFLLLLTFACIWASDIGAFFVGKAFGKTKLSPRISPKKTVEGAIFGTGGSIAVGLAGAFWMHWQLWQVTGAIFGLLIGVFGLLGDLTESLLKRDAGVKDSGNVMPGHGGILDRADSYIFTAPIAFYYANIFVLERFFWR
jgi:phosphatidate cytidylyltransferase